MNESARRDFVRSVIGGSVIASSYAAAVMPAGADPKNRQSRS
jgi:hypothetical protein